MAIFKPGMRVVLARAFRPVNQDATGRFIHYQDLRRGDKFEDTTLTMDFDCVVEWDRPVFWKLRGTRILSSSVTPCNAHQLEPIVPLGAKPSQFATLEDLRNHLEKDHAVLEE